MGEVGVGDGVGDIGGELRVGRAVGDAEDEAVGRATDLQVFENDGRVVEARFEVGRRWSCFSCSSRWNWADGAQDAIGLDEFDLGGEELVGVVARIGLHCILADDAARSAPIYVHTGSGFVDRRDAGGDHPGESHADEDESRRFSICCA